MKNETEDEELEDMLTNLDPAYESIEELKIGRLLDQYGIPFFYKQPMVVYNQGKNEIWKPTFTLLSYGGLVIDYIPGIEKEKRAQALQRKQIYKYNQIPAIVMGQKDLTNRNWQQQLYNTLANSYQSLTKNMNHMASVKY